MYYVRVYDDAGIQQGSAFRATSSQLKDLRDQLPVGWTAVGRPVKI